MCTKIAKSTKIPIVSIKNTPFKPNLACIFRFLLPNMTLQNLVICQFLFAMWCEKYLRQPGDNYDKSKILIIAPTGIAAVQIGKFQKKITKLILHILD